ncbi:MAG: F0F1 ATP synthase subunit I [Pseudomonadales bacterium]|uniref:F0F1 ATP synthase subunit I n=1 Tax=Oleiphilus messinensis TaxID=141451 RepID=A0A1Y0IJJ0_9GAMM|nr:F0F1 ATP synthase subunit I [Oleiphilus messinensis]ARU59603.1 F0F1 ATP synthase subunit I [Oleiphilus messinensis]MCG8612088.1 F0F1 ATP synthase subunit I [Pseudomonadales bacterium]
MQVSHIRRPPIERVIIVQVIVVAVVSLAFGFRGEVSFYSAVLGGCIFVIPNAYFAFKAFAHNGARAAQQIVKAFYTGEAVKLILTAVAFTMVFVLVKPLDVFALFLTFFISLMTNWLTPWVLGRKSQQK